FWRFACYEDDDVPDQSLVFVFGWDDDLGGQFLLNYNVRGRDGEPGVCEYFDDPGDLSMPSKSVSRFFAKLLTLSETPQVDWSETQRLKVIARESIDLSPVYGAPAKLENVLGRQRGELVLFTHEQTPEIDILMQTTLPEPLDADAASVEVCRPDPVPTYTLHLEPEDADEVVHLESTRTDDGRWKNTSDRGVPVYVEFESPDIDRLGRLRRELFGEDAVRVERQDAAQRQLLDRIESLPPDEQRAAGLQMFLQMKEQFDQLAARELADLDDDEVPPELAAAVELMEQKLQDAIERAEHQIAAHPLDPQTARLMEDWLRAQGEFDEGEEE
ncbi:MAG: tetratricopeptide repeat protein, partial [Planctomycetaceae bacterium]